MFFILSSYNPLAFFKKSCAHIHTQIQIKSLEDSRIQQGTFQYMCVYMYTYTHNILISSNLFLFLEGTLTISNVLKPRDKCDVHLNAAKLGGGVQLRIPN